MTSIVQIHKYTNVTFVFFFGFFTECTLLKVAALLLTLL